jgi:hypothetical protein
MQSKEGAGKSANEMHATPNEAINQLPVRFLGIKSHFHEGLLYKEIFFSTWHSNVLDLIKPWSGVRAGCRALALYSISGP